MGGEARWLAEGFVAPPAHVEEMARNESFNYAIFDGDETALKGCLYIDPPGRGGADADVSWPPASPAST